MLACLRRQIEQMEFRAAHARFGIACTGAQHFVLPIVQLSHFPGKNIAEDKVCRFQNLLARAEVAREQELCALVLVRRRKRRPGVVMLQKDARIGQAEAVDALFDVTYREKVFSFTRYRVKDPVLHLVGILILVHHDLAVARAHKRRKLRRLTVFPNEQADGLVLLIGEVSRIPPPLFLIVLSGKVRRQVDERKHGGRHCTKILHRLV